MPDTHSGLLDRHIAFLEALRAAGLPVSLAEDLDAVSVLRALDWSDRRVVKEGYAAAVVKRHQWRPTFDALAAAYARAQRFDEAAATASTALAAGEGTLSEGDRDEIRKRRELYQTRRPYTQGIR